MRTNTNTFTGFVEIKMKEETIRPTIVAKPMNNSMKEITLIRVLYFMSKNGSPNGSASLFGRYPMVELRRTYYIPA